MKSIATKSLAVVALVAAMGVSVPAVAFAASTTASTSNTATASTPWTTWRATWVTYVQGIKAINATFHTSIGAARSTLQAALAASTTKADRQAAIAAFEVSAVAALNVRVAAITAAGDPPAPVSYTHLDVYKRQEIHTAVLQQWQRRGASHPTTVGLDRHEMCIRDRS